MLAELEPLGVGDIDAFIAKQAPALSADNRQVMAKMLVAMNKTTPADMAEAVNLFLKCNP